MNKSSITMTTAGVAIDESYITPMSTVSAKDEAPETVSGTPDLPDYLVDTYTWAYVRPQNIRFLDRGIVVESILWGNGRYLMDWAFCEFSPGQDIMQPASVYGPFSRRLANVVGPEGSLEVRDIQAVQVEHTRVKVADCKHVTLKVADASQPVGREFDGICCFFLLHEVPDDWKTRIINSLLAGVRPGGKVVFVDYHRPSSFHPLRPIMMAVNRFLEPYADALWKRDIRSFATRDEGFTWTKETCFGGLYQKVVAVRGK